MAEQEGFVCISVSYETEINVSPRPFPGEKQSPGLFHLDLQIPPMLRNKKEPSFRMTLFVSGGAGGI